MVRLILYFVICLAATTVGAISGVGGGVIIKPVFDAVSGLEVAQISFLSGCTVLAMTVVSLLSARGGGVRVEARRGTLLALGGAAGGVLGKQLFESVKRAAGNGALVGVVQSVLMVLLTAGVLLYMRLRPRIRTKNVQNGAMCVHRRCAGRVVRFFGYRRRADQSGGFILFLFHGYQNRGAQLPVCDLFLPDCQSGNDAGGRNCARV